MEENKKRKRDAVWLSHSSISLYLKCPKAYYLGNVYRNPKTGNRIGIISPPLALGQAVHEVLEQLSEIPAEERFTTSLLDRYEKAWGKVSGQLGGFISKEEEKEYKDRGEGMLKRVTKNPGILKNKAVKIQTDGFIPHYWLSEEDNLVLCGKIDWLEYLPESDSVHIVDFKTGKQDEAKNSLQLPIYLLLTLNCQKRTPSKASYWYVDREDSPQEVELPNPEEAKEDLIKIGKRIKLARELKAFKCPKDTCIHCRAYEAILRGEALYVGQSDSRQDMYVVPNQKFKVKGEKLGKEDDEDSVVL